MPSGVQTCALDRKSTRLNSSHGSISYAVFCLQKNNAQHRRPLRRILPRPDSLLHTTIRSPQTFSSTAAPATRTREPTRVNLRIFFFNDTATTEIYTLSLHDALPI